MRRVRHAASCLVVLLALSAGGSAASASATENGVFTLGKVPTVVNGLSGVTQVASGGGFGLALLPSGKVMAWGSNESGQLGDGNTKKSSVPVEVLGLEKVVQIAANGNHALALLENGTVWAWGAGEYGQIGNGGTANSTKPVQVPGVSGATAISAGGYSSYAVVAEGRVMAWGLNAEAQLGDEPPHESGRGVTGPELCENAETAGLYYGCSRTPVAVAGVTEATSVVGGGYHALAVLANHTAVAWGSDQYGQLGIGEVKGESCSVPFHVFSCSGKAVPVVGMEGLNVTSVAAGWSFSLAVLSTGHAMAWGEDFYGELGDGQSGSFTNKWSPVEVKKLSTATAVGASASSTALLEGGTLAEWGGGTTEPAPVAGLTGVTGLAANGGLAIAPHGPVVSGVEPGTGSPLGGETVTIKGSGFTPGMIVRFGEDVAQFEYVSPTEARAQAPAQKPGSVAVTVENQGRSEADAESEYTYVPVGIELGRCSKVTAGTGGYKNNACTEVLAGSTYRWTAGVERKKFTSADATENVEREVEGKVEKVTQPKKVVFETIGRTELVCKNETGAGEYAGTDQVRNLLLTFSGCELGGAKCASPRAAEGEIVTNPLEAVLGWREREANKVALDVKPMGEETGFLEATCGSATVKVRGRVIGTITSVDKMVGTFSLNFGQSNGKQSIEALEGETEKEVLEMSISTITSGFYLQSGMKLDSKLANEESIEINTVA